MTFVPNTTYKVCRKNGSVIYSGLNFYEAMEKLRTTNLAKYVKDDSNHIVFTKSDSTDNFENEPYRLYQFNNYCGTTENISQSLSGEASDELDKMRGWLEAFEYSKAFRSDGVMANSRIRRKFKHSAISVADIYDKQEKNSGGYFEVRTLSSLYTNVSYIGASVDIPIKDIVTSSSSLSYNGYIFIGITGHGGNCEAGIMFNAKNAWKVFYNDGTNPNKKQRFNTLDTIYTFSSTVKYIRITMNKISPNKAKFSFAALDSNRAVVEDNYLSYTSYGDVFNSNYSHELYRSVSLCPPESTEDENIVTNLNNSEFFSNVKMTNCLISRVGSSNKPWPYNASFNQFAVLFNEEFVDHSASSSGDTITISYKGRNASGNLQT